MTTAQTDTFSYTTFAKLHALMSDDPSLFQIEEAVVCAPVDLEGLCGRMAALVKDPAAKDRASVRAAVQEAIQSSALPGHSIDAAFAVLLDEAMLKVGTMHVAISEAFAHARHLMDTLGEDDPRTFHAVMAAIELQDPGCCGRMLKECGIHLPEASCVDTQGRPLISLEQLATALDADPVELLERAKELEAVGMKVFEQPAGRLQ